MLITLCVNLRETFPNFLFPLIPLIFAGSFSALIYAICGKPFLFLLPLIQLIFANSFSALICAICGNFS